MFVNVVDRFLSVYLVSRCVGPFRLFQDVWRCAGLSWVDSDHQFVFGYLNLFFLLVVFMCFRTSFYVVFGCFVNCCFLSRSFGVVLLCFCLVFDSFNFLWIVFGFRGCFRWFILVSSVQVCVVCFSSFWVVVGCCGWFLVVDGSWMLHKFFVMFSHLQVVSGFLSWVLDSSMLSRLV